MKLQIDLSGRAGLAPHYWGDLDYFDSPWRRILGSDGQMAQGYFNPTMRYGYLGAASNTFTNITAASGQPANNFSCTSLCSTNGYALFGEKGQKIYYGYWNATDLTLSLDLGAGAILHDMQIYQINGVEKMFYSYEDASGNLEVGYAGSDRLLTSPNNDWLTTDATGNFTRTLTNRSFMEVADDGFMYLFADGAVHKIDGRGVTGLPGTITEDILKFADNWQITDAINYRGNIYIAIRQDTKNQLGRLSQNFVNSPNIGIFVWDKISTVVSMRDYIKIPGIQEIRNIYISPQGDLRIMTRTTNKYSQIRSFTGSSFKVIQDLGYYASPFYPDAVTTYDLLTIWLSRSGTIYAHGQLSGQDKEALYFLGQAIPLTGYNRMNTGAIVSSNIPSENIVFSYQDDSDVYQIKRFKLRSGTQHKGNVFTLVKMLPTMSTVNYIDIYCLPHGSGAGTVATIKPYFNQSSTAWASKAITGAESARGYYRIDVDKPYINAVQLEIEFAEVAISNNNFAPSYAIIDYTPTKTKG